MRVDTYSESQPAWVDLATPDIRGMISIYGELFGWESTQQTRGSDPDYYIQSLGDAPVGAIYRQPRVEASTGIPPYWLTYFTVSDVDAAVARATEAGGEVLIPATDIPGAGRMARVAEPGRAAIVLWQAGEMHGAGVIKEPGATAWYELQTGDDERAAAFMKAVLDIDTVPSDGRDYRLLQLNGETIGGLRRIPYYLTPRLIPFFQVDDVDAALGVAGPKGCNVLSAPSDEPMGRVCTLQDPQGAPFGLIAPR